jgi:four helix bundle protein
MFLHLSHTKLEIFGVTKALTTQCYLLSSQLPVEERFSMASQLKRAALSVHLNNPERCSRKSLAKRKRFSEVSRSSLVEVDTIIDMALEMNYINKESVEELGRLIILAFKLLTGLINANPKT